MLMIIWWREEREREGARRVGSSARKEGRKRERTKIAVEFVPGDLRPVATKALVPIDANPEVRYVSSQLLIPGHRYFVRKAQLFWTFVRIL